MGMSLSPRPSIDEIREPGWAARSAAARKNAWPLSMPANALDFGAFGQRIHASSSAPTHNDSSAFHH